MSKIVAAANSMIVNQSKISPVIPGDNDEYYFAYDDRYRWSIRASEADNDIFLYFYKTDLPIERIVEFDGLDWQNFRGMVTYSAKAIGTKEASQTFKELFLVVKEKAYGIDEVLDDIIDDL